MNQHISVQNINYDIKKKYKYIKLLIIKKIFKAIKNICDIIKIYDICDICNTGAVWMHLKYINRLNRKKAER